jgi:hypothetical protein
MKHSRTLTLVAALLLPGCTTLEWHKDGATAETRDRDFTACAAKAQADTRHLTLLPPPQVVVDAQGRVIPVQPPRQDSERFIAEQDLLRACMQARGYALRESAAKTN